jgi:hypothetical protein
MIRSFDMATHTLFRRTIDRNVVKEPPWMAKLNNRFFVDAMWRAAHPNMTSPFADRGAIRNKRAYQAPHQSPLTQKYWESTLDLKTHPGGTDPWLVELARVDIQWDEVGVIKGFQQYLVNEVTHYSESANWGRPFVPPTEASLTWYFRVESITGPTPPAISLLNPGPQDWPGAPHQEFPQCRDLWFPACSPASQNFHLTVGPGNRLRVLALVDLVTDVDIEISAKISGYRMSLYAAETLLAIRALW